MNYGSAYKPLIKGINYKKVVQHILFVRSSSKKNIFVCVDMGLQVMKPFYF